MLMNEKDLEKVTGGVLGKNNKSELLKKRDDLKERLKYQSYTKEIQKDLEDQLREVEEQLKG